MSDKSLLNELMEKIKENQQLREQETMSLTDTPQFGFPLSDKLKADNPGIPDSDIQQMRAESKEGLKDYMEGVGSVSGGINSSVVNNLKSIGNKVIDTVDTSKPLNKFRKLFGMEEKLSPETTEFAEHMIKNKKSNPVYEADSFTMPDEVTQNKIMQQWNKEKQVDQDITNQILKQAEEMKRNRLMPTQESLDKTIVSKK